MRDLLSIGAFSGITGISVKALRLYDKLGILQPATVDFSSGYRYYHPKQSAVAERIRLLRSAHMPLTEIRALLAADDPASVHFLLDRHRGWLTEQLGEYERALCLLPTGQQWCIDTGKEHSMNPETQTYTCSFCGKPNEEVSRMIAGPDGVAICEGCVTLCNEIISRAHAEEAEA